MMDKGLLRPAARCARAAALAASPILMVAPAHAQSFERFSTSLTDSLERAVDLLPEGVNNIRLGAGPAIYPEFEGSRRYGWQALPVVSARYRDWFEIANNEIKITAFNRLFSTDANGQTPSRALRAGPLVSINFGRGERDSPDLRGMGSVGTSLELGAFIAYDVSANSRVRLRARQDVAGGHDGATAQLDYSYTFIHTPRITLSATAAVEYASAVYMKAFFGVTGLQSARSGLPVYRPGTGFKDAFIGANCSYALSDHWSLFLYGGYERLLARAADSPLVERRGSPDQFSASTFVVYSF